MDEPGASVRNRLWGAGSVYLRQHASQQVDWRPWNDDAFAEARALDKPILLSIGYAACHWCHVMARESFADHETAGLMNALFVCIKVDREERPDIDRFYLAALARVGRAAGWPLTAFLEPDGRAFEGGGYFPPEPRFGLPSFRGVLRDAAHRYRARRLDAVFGASPRPANAGAVRGDAVQNAIPALMLDRLARSLADEIDPLYGGFGTDGPKFPQAAGHELVLRAWRRTGDASFLDAVACSAARMASGAIYDHIGGGFHRYAVDDRWHLPHFEKMLIDNAMMIRLLTQLWQATHGALFASRVTGSVRWLLREMRRPDGGFASSLAAYSRDARTGEDEDGAFYRWTRAELDRAVPHGDPDFWSCFEAAADERASGLHTLVRRHGPDGWSEQAADQGSLDRLYATRDRRMCPLRDDALLADRNGFAIAALAEAAMAFGRFDWLEAAAQAFATVATTLGCHGTLAHGTAGLARGEDGMLDDYAAMAQAALALYEATSDMRHVEQAVAWIEHLDLHFGDGETGGYFSTADRADLRLPRQKSIDETASPSGNGLMLGVLSRLHALTGDDRFRRRAEGIVRCFGDHMSRARLQTATALCQGEAMTRLTQIVVVGQGDNADALRREASSHYVPDRLLIAIAEDAVLWEGHPASGKSSGPGASAFVCIGQTCLPATSTITGLRTMLTAPREA